MRVRVRSEVGEGCEDGEEQVGGCGSEGGVGQGHGAVAVGWCHVCVCGMGPLDIHVVGEGDEEWGVRRMGVVHTREW